MKSEKRHPKAEVGPLGLGYGVEPEGGLSAREKMLLTVLESIRQRGLVVGFETINVEAFIREAGISRSTFYRIWPTQDHFYAELILKLSDEVHPMVAAYDGSTLEVAISMMLSHSNQLVTSVSRKALLSEVVKQGALQNFITLKTSTDWQIYVAIIATTMGLKGVDTLQSSARSRIAHSENWFLDSMSQFYDQMLPLLGFRIRADLPQVSTRLIALLGAASVKGLSLDAVSLPEITTTTVSADPFNTGTMSDWHLPSLGFASSVAHFIEEHPDVSGTWSEEKISTIENQLKHMIEALRLSPSRVRSDH